MALFGSFRARRLAARALEAFQEEGWDAASAALGDAGELAAAAWAELAVALYNEEHPDEAERAVRRALELEPDRGEAVIFLAELLTETGRVDDAIAAYRGLLTRFPGAAMQAFALAKLLIGRGEFEEAKLALLPFAAHPSQELRLTLATAHYELREFPAVVALLEPTVRQMKLELQTSAFYGKARDEMFASYQDAVRLHDEAFAAVHGREQVIESAAARGDLNARAGVNYKLLGEARMTAPPGWAADIRLRSVEEGIAFGNELVAAGERSRGLCHLGVSSLRAGRLDEALRQFHRARDEDDDNFAAFLGIGAAMDLQSTHAFDLLPRLPEVGDAPDAVARVVVDWPALTVGERQIVLVAARPLAGLLARAARAGAIARILPIDARLTDLPEMREGSEERLEDHRCIEAITGAATARVCASKIEDLLHVAGEGHSVFAHELAHLAHYHAPDDVARRIDDLYERAAEEEHVITAYQATNAAEFFAVAYTDYLAQAYDLPLLRELDEAGIVEDTFALIDELG